MSPVMKRTRQDTASQGRASLQGVADALKPQKAQHRLSSPFRRNEANGRPMYEEDKSIVLRGLCDTLKAAFRPHYRHETVTKKGGGKRLTPRQGRAVGKQVDAELQDEISGRPRKRARHEYTEAILDRLKKSEYDLKECQAEVGLLKKDLNLYTAVDIVCHPRASQPNAVVLGEVKCRQSDDYETVPKGYKPQKTWSHKMTGGERKWIKEHPTQLLPPYDDKPLTIHNFDQLQMGWTQAAYKETHPRATVEGSMLLRAHRHGLHTYPLEPWVLDPARRDAAEARMLAVRARPKRRVPTKKRKRRT